MIKLPFLKMDFRQLWQLGGQIWGVNPIDQHVMLANGKNDPAINPEKNLIRLPVNRYRSAVPGFWIFVFRFTSTLYASCFGL